MSETGRQPRASLPIMILDRSFELSVKYQYTENQSSVDRYNYDKPIIKIVLSKQF